MGSDNDNEKAASTSTASGTLSFDEKDDPENDDDDDLDDSLSNLFSFAAASPTNSPKRQLDSVLETASGTSPLAKQQDDPSDASEDSFLRLLNEEQPLDILHLSATNGINEAAYDYDDKDTQEILDWLDEEDEKAEQKDAEKSVELPSPPEPKPLELPKSEPSEPKGPEFETLEEAVKSNKSTIKQIRKLLNAEHFQVKPSVRPHLWCRVVCGKPLEHTLQSSVADSFQHWEQQQQQLSDSKSALPDDHWIYQQSSILAERMTATGGNKQLTQKALVLLLMNHFNIGKKGGDRSDCDDEHHPAFLMDPLLPPVAATILSAGVPKVAAAVMLNHIVPSYMPILALTHKERQHAAETLHLQFYYLCLYHLPLMVLHLDRSVPDWYQWPPKGLMPESWLVSHLAGECGGTMMNPKKLLSLWDLILVSNNASLRFFLVMAILEQNSDKLLQLTGDAVREEFEKIMAFREDEATEGFQIEGDSDTKLSDAVHSVHEWSVRAEAMWMATPLTVVSILKQVEDEAVREALTKRQAEAEERLQRKLEDQAKAHQDAAEAERERKAEEARLRLTRARLVAFYRTYNPGKETNIDKIMATYEGRYEVLDAKLKQKYGVGFNPALKATDPRKNSSSGTAKESSQSTQNQRASNRKQGFFGKLGRNTGDYIIPDSERAKKVVVNVDASEVLTVICWSKERNQERLAQAKKISSVEGGTRGTRIPLKFYLIDSRPEASVLDQGRFPTSVSLSPETLLDPEKLKVHEEMFESLRAGAHIVIMGEGFSALPALYGHTMTQAMAEHIKEDETRNNLCALHFVKRGFPYVSIMQGGFASAHAWLCREGPKNKLRVYDVLDDYNPDVSLFGQFEKLFRDQQKVANSTGRDKTQRALQGLFDSSMTALTKASVMRFENQSIETSTRSSESVRPKGISSFFGGGRDANKTRVVASVPAATKSGEIQRKLDAFRPGRDESQPPEKIDKLQDSLVVESIDFDTQSVGSSSDQVDTVKSDAETERTVEQKSNAPRSVLNSFRKTASKDDNESCNPEAGSQPDRPNNRFAGIGAALNNSLKRDGGKAASTQQQPGVARNPFARFGKAGSDNKGPGKAAPFGGFAQLRKAAMVRSTSAEKDNEEDPNVEEESVDFN